MGSGMLGWECWKRMPESISANLFISRIIFDDSWKRMPESISANPVTRHVSGIVTETQTFCRFFRYEWAK